jgi:hypothetical protein
VKRHPLAVPAVVLAVMGFVPLVVVGGVLGALLGAIAGSATRRHPERWRTTSAADAAIAIGAVTGFLPMLVLGAVKMDDWGPAPLVVTVALVAVTGAIAGGGALGARRAAAGAATGVAVAGGGTVVVVGLAVLVIWFFIWMAQIMWAAVF